MWSSDLPNITGLNERLVWIHLDLIPFEEQRKHQKPYDFHNRKCRNKLVRVSRSSDVNKLVKCLRHQEKFFIFCSVNDHHTHIIIQWLTWIKVIPTSLKRYFDYGDKYEYEEINQEDFERWWCELPNFTR